MDLNLFTPRAVLLKTPKAKEILEFLPAFRVFE
jgi:hypothetical protein